MEDAVAEHTVRAGMRDENERLERRKMEAEEYLKQRQTKGEGEISLRELLTKPCSSVIWASLSARDASNLVSSKMVLSYTNRPVPSAAPAARRILCLSLEAESEREPTRNARIQARLGRVA